MFGFFKKKPLTAMDGLVRAIYGDHPPVKSADLERAITIAHEDLLLEQVAVSEVERHATALFNGPMPYSTHDLAVSTALAFFKKPELLDALQECQLFARMRVLNWVKAGKVVAPLAQSFEEVLYRVYKPTAQPPSEPTDDLTTKFEAFKKQNAGTPMMNAVKVVRDLMIWQHKYAERKKPDDADRDEAQRIERAFLLGAAGMACEAFSIPDEKEELFMMNVLGTYRGMEYERGQRELAGMFEAGDAEPNAVSIGGAVMIDYLVNGKQEQHEVHLAALLGYY